MESPDTSALKQFRIVMAALVALYLIFAVLLIVTPNGLMWLVNGVAGFISEKMVAPTLAEIPAEHIWHDIYAKDFPRPPDVMLLPNHALLLSLALAYLAVLIITGGLIAYEPDKYAPLIAFWFGGHAITGLTGLFYYLWSYPYFINLLLPIVDGLMLILLLVFWLRARPVLARMVPDRA